MTQNNNDPIKFDYFRQCDKFRTEFPSGEAIFQAMMVNRVSLSSIDGFDIDASALLDEDESLNDWTYLQVASDVESSWYTSEVEGVNFLFYQTAGFEFIFVRESDYKKLQDALTKELTPGFTCR